MIKVIKKALFKFNDIQFGTLLSLANIKNLG